jgi:hypothetical protein
MHLRVIIFAICIFALSGCKPTYTYNHAAYPTCEAALNAAQQDAQQKLATIQSKPSPVNCSAKVVIPTFKKIGIDGVYRRGNPDLAQVNYVAKVIYLGFRGMGAALIKRNLFAEVAFEEAYDTEMPEIGKHDFLIWLHLNEQGNAHWYLLSRISKEKVEIPMDLALSGSERLATWLAGIEKEVEASHHTVKQNKNCNNTDGLSNTNTPVAVLPGRE